MVGTMFGAVLFYDPYASRGQAALLAIGMILFALLLPWAVTITIAYVVRRKRPYQHDGFAPFFQMPWVTPSFPSGHATYAFGLVAMAFASIPFLGWLFLPLACFVILGRVASGVHYVSDVLAGSVIGFSVVTVLAHLIAFLFIHPIIYY
jgi:undecaprenyl-diphosphatase